MIIIDICIIVAVLVFLSATTYEYLTARRDNMYEVLYNKEKEYTDYLANELKQRENKIKELENEILKNS